MAHTFNFSTQEVEAADLSGFEARIGYIVRLPKKQNKMKESKPFGVDYIRSNLCVKKF